MPDTNRSIDRPSKVAIVGAGITGLSAAYQLLKDRPDVELCVFDSASAAGGILQSVHRDGFLIERSADNFLTKLPWGKELCRELGLEEQLLSTEESRRKALVVHRGCVRPVPDGFLIMAPTSLRGVLRSPVLSVAGKFRVCLEPLVPRRRQTDDQSVADFARRRLGREAFERIVQPLLGGIYTADPEKLSMAATMPQYIEQVEEFGSLYQAARRQRKAVGPEESGARYSLFVTPEKGLEQLTLALVDRLPEGSLRLNSRVSSLVQSGEQWQLTVSGHKDAETFDAVIVATPAYLAAKLLTESLPELAGELAEIEYAGASVVCLGYRRQQIGAELTGFGFVVPSVENRKLIAVSFASLKFPGRAPEGHILIRAFVGGALQPELADLPDEELQQLVSEELADLLQITGEPVVVEIARWQRAMPQYHVGHLDQVFRIESLLAQHAGLELAGAAYRGVGIPQCIHSGQEAAMRIASVLPEKMPAKK